MLDKITKIFIKIQTLSKTKKILMVVLLIGLFGLVPCLVIASFPLAPPNPMLYGNPIGALITGFGNFFNTVLLKLPTALAMIIVQVGGFIINLEGKLLSWVIDFGSFTKLGVVQEGWRICRDFANLFFIAILIYIAFSIILRVQKMDAKKMLFKVITIAIIINFSLMIGGIIIDFSQVLFRYFIFAPLQGQDRDGFHFSKILMNAVGVQKMLVTSAPLDAGSVLVRLIFVIIFTFLCVIVFGALVFVLFIRNFWLWILLILAPLAWFLGIVPVPMLSKYAGEWWRNFIKWCFMAPIMGFFIFLSVGILGSNQKMADQLTQPLTKIGEQHTPNNKLDKSVISFSERPDSIFHPKTLIKFLITLAFLIGGLMAGQSLGSGAARGALSMVTKAGKNTQKWMGRKAMQTAPVRGVGNVLMGMGNIPLVGGVFKRAGMATQRGAAGAKGEDLKKAQNRINYMSDDQLKKNWNTFNQFEKQAATKKLHNNKLDAKQFEDMQKIYSSKGMNKELKDMEKVAPHFTSDFKKEAEELASKVKKLDEKKDANEKETKIIDALVQGQGVDIKKKEDASKSADVIYKDVEEKVKKAEAEVGVLENSGAPQSMVVEAKNRLVGGAKRELTEANKNRNEANSALQFASSRLEELEKKRKGVKDEGGKIDDEYRKAGAPVLELLKDTNIPKLNGLSKMMSGENINSHQSQAILYAVEQGSGGNITNFVLNNQIKENGKIDMEETAKLRREIVDKIADDLFKSGGSGALLKMGKMNSSPSAMAGGLSFNSTLDSMFNRGVIGTQIKTKMEAMFRGQKNIDKIISEISENVKENRYDKSTKESGKTKEESETE